jgi:hypothetical protein
LAITLGEHTKPLLGIGLYSSQRGRDDKLGVRANLSVQVESKNILEHLQKMIIFGILAAVL